MDESNAQLKAKFALAVASGQPVGRAARALGVPSRTAYRWSKAPEFIAAVQAVRRRALDRAVGRLGKVTVKAVATLERLMGTGNPEAIQLGAARAVLGSVIDLRSNVEMAERLDQLEARLGVAATSNGRARR